MAADKIQKPKSRLPSFKPLEEGWCSYSLSDGNVLRIKVAMTKILLQTDEQGQTIKNPAGEPLYFFQTQNITQTLTADEYNQMRKEENKV